MVIETWLLFLWGVAIRDGCCYIGVIIGVAKHGFGLSELGVGVIIKGDIAIWGGHGHERVWLY